MLRAPVVLGSGKVIKPANNNNMASSQYHCQGVTAADQGRSLK